MALNPGETLTGAKAVKEAIQAQLSVLASLGTAATFFYVDDISFAL